MKYTLQKALDAAQQGIVDRYFQNHVNMQMQHSCTSCATILLALPPDSSGAAVKHWLRTDQDEPPLAALADADPAGLHTDPEAVRDLLTAALANLPPATAWQLDGAAVGANRNVRFESKASGEEVRGRHAISVALEVARTQLACGPGGTPMDALLKHHGEGAGAYPNNPGRQHTQQCGHAETVAAAIALRGQLTGDAYKTHDPAERAPPLCLLLVVSRSCCNSCRYALPHLARLLRVDIVAQFRTHDGELSAPVLFAWRDAPPAAQLPWLAPTP